MASPPAVLQRREALAKSQIAASLLHGVSTSLASRTDAPKLETHVSARQRDRPWRARLVPPSKPIMVRLQLSPNHHDGEGSGMGRRGWSSAVSILLGVASAGAPGSSLASQDTERTTGSILGSVFDSTTSAPLPNARVAVFGTGLVAETNEQGRFRLDNVPVGERSVVYFHQRLARLGVGATPVRVLVESGSVSRVSLAVPSRSTILSAWCSAEPAEGPTSVGGIVTDALTGVPLPRARVRTLGSRTGILQRRRVVREVGTEASGEFFRSSPPSSSAPWRLRRRGRSAGLGAPNARRPGFRR